MLVGIALCGVVPAYGLEFQPESSSFAYPASHFYAGMPFDYVTAFPSQPEPEAAPMPSEQASATEPSRSELCSTAVSAAEANRLPVRFFANLIQQESGFKPHVVSRAGAQGIAQFMPEVAAEQGLSNPFDPIQALHASAKFVANLVERFGNLGLAAAAYNAGSKRVSDWLARRGRLPAETRNYVRTITGRPAEKWVRVAAKVQQVRLSPQAPCPALQMAAAPTPVRTKLPVVHGRARLAAVAPVRPVRIAASRPSRHAAPAARHAVRVRLAAIR
jgi:hypothetical protein